MTTGRYTRIGSSKGPLTIGGAEKKMGDDSSFTYIPGHNVAGPLSEVEAWLDEHHPDDTKTSLQGAYNLKNLKKVGVRKSFAKELEQWQTHREDAQKKRQDDRQINLLILVEFFKRYQEQRKSDGLSRPSGGGRKTIRDKLSEVIVSGKVMDVTSAQEKGRGITRAVMKNNSIKCRLTQDSTDPLYNVVYNPKTATAGVGVRNFLTEYGGFTDGQISVIVDAIADNREVSVARTVTPSRQRTSSPLTKRFSSPLRRDMDTSVDDLLDNLA